MAVSRHIPSRYSPQDAPPPAGQSAVPAVYFEQGHINPWRMSSQRLFWWFSLLETFIRPTSSAQTRLQKEPPRNPAGLQQVEERRTGFHFSPYLLYLKRGLVPSSKASAPNI